MLDALCSFNDEAVTYSVFRFQKLSDAEIEAYRHWLSCPACGGKAYYRKASSDGKAACFGSRYHSLDCREYHPSAQRSQEEQDALEVQQLLLDADALLIDFSRMPRRPSKALAADGQADEKATELPAAGAVAVSAKGAAGEAAAKANAQSEPRVASQGLQTLLHSLLRGSDLADSDLWIYTDSERKYRWRARNLFVNFADAEPADGHKPHMYWGTISHTDKDLLWLNPADAKDIGIPIAPFKPELLKRFGITDRRDLEGAGIILFGKCFWNKDKSRKIIQLWQNDVQRLYISKLED
ncbi:hypothetical protein LZP73_04515 [Shewanella sp. AS16]|uniref:hypothetical protein n=1 Tax=Shewanella sp. AS16 TaxID=2907625 RepID=UPI001F45EF09|nr:hypothetical protein [Shewanella sp. AS16]MCE9685481.1 hypothetical protein [Shewanella sp. AS16]